MLTFGSLVYYRPQCRAWAEVVPGILIGRTLTEAEAAEVVKQGVMAVLDLTAEFSEPRAKTLEIIADRLGVHAEEIKRYQGSLERKGRAVEPGHAADNSLGSRLR